MCTKLNLFLHVNKKVKFSHTHYRALGPELIPLYRQSARRWLEAIHPAVGCHYFQPGLRLPPQPKSITAHRPVPNYTAWWQRHMRVSSLPKAVTWKLTGRDSNPRPSGSRANAVSLSHTDHFSACNLHFLFSPDLTPIREHPHWSLHGNQRHRQSPCSRRASKKVF